MLRFNHGKRDMTASGEAARRREIYIPKWLAALGVAAVAGAGLVGNQVGQKRAESVPAVSMLNDPREMSVANLQLKLKIQAERKEHETAAAKEIQERVANTEPVTVVFNQAIVRENLRAKGGDDYRVEIFLNPCVHEEKLKDGSIRKTYVGLDGNGAYVATDGSSMSMQRHIDTTIGVYVVGPHEARESLVRLTETTRSGARQVVDSSSGNQVCQVITPGIKYAALENPALAAGVESALNLLTAQGPQ